MTKQKKQQNTVPDPGLMYPLGLAPALRRTKDEVIASLRSELNDQKALATSDKKTMERLSLNNIDLSSQLYAVKKQLEFYIEAEKTANDRRDLFCAVLVGIPIILGIIGGLGYAGALIASALGY